jgi:serine/threonine protein phosphatase PrpC
MLSIAHKIESGDRGEDRIAIDHHDNDWIIVVADGAGGTGSGAEAAQAVCDGMIAEFRAHLNDLDNILWGASLEALDKTMLHTCNGGMTTAVVVAINNGRVTGASVGDSMAWLISDFDIIDLTHYQQRQPLLGSGEANPIGFRPMFMNGRIPYGRLLVGTDGLFKYAPPDRIERLARSDDLEKATSSLIDTVRLRSGALPDDVAVVLCEYSVSVHV